MEARRIRPTLLGMATVVALLAGSHAQAQFGSQQQSVAHSQNFIVFASSPQFAAQVSKAAEDCRSRLAQYWLGKELPPWSQRCPIHVTSSPKLGAGGETRFSLMPGGVGNWMMSVQGTEQRVLDSVLPHEITHTIFATHFAPYDKYVPRWADEGACTTVEHVEEKSKHQHFLQEFLRTGRGISFNKMFSLKDYPKDILPLYAQGHSVVQFLLDQGGPRKFVGFLETGMRTDAWQVAMKEHYAYETIGALQMNWNNWLKDGSPESIISYAPSLRNGGVENAIALASTKNPVASDSNVQFAANERRVPSPESLAANGRSPLQGLEQASFASGPSWYRSRLRAVTSNGASNDMASASNVHVEASPNVQASESQLRAISQVATESNQSYPFQAYQASRQAASQPQRNSIQVLDWGNSEPVAGVATQPQMVPLMR